MGPGSQQPCLGTYQGFLLFPNCVEWLSRLAAPDSKLSIYGANLPFKGCRED
jgi:hypothetical protein